MPNLPHEAVVELLQNEPLLVLELLARAGIDVPPRSRVSAAIADSNLTDRDSGRDPEQVRALFSDNVFIFRAGSRKFAVIAEAQTTAPGKSRALSWPAYVANARRRHRCAALLLVFATTSAAARGSGRPIRTGHPGWDLTPLITGIGQMPLTAPGTRFAAELALLNIITGDLALDTHENRMLAVTAIRFAPPSRFERYTRYIRALAPLSARAHLEVLMKIELKDAWVDGLLDQGRAEGRAQGEAEGRAQGHIEMLLQLLGTRFAIPASIRSRVMACTDTTQISIWFDRAITATSLDEVFAKLPSRSPGCQALAEGVATRDHATWAVRLVAWRPAAAAVRK
jgi:hypothetical protein